MSTSALRVKHRMSTVVDISDLRVKHRMSTSALWVKHCNNPWGFCQVEKNPRKTQEVGGWVKAQLGFLFFGGNFVFFCVVSMFQKKIKIGKGGGWMGSEQSVFLGFLEFFNLTRPLNPCDPDVKYCDIYVFFISTCVSRF